MTAAIAKPQIVSPSPEILNSWKEIARYLNRGVRTVQRWEALGLPVRRPHGRGRSAVFAVRSELDRWITSCPLDNHEEMRLANSLAFESTKILVLESHRLRESMSLTRKQLNETIDRLVQTLGKMLPPSNIGSSQL